ncbi:MAG: GNAT family N-acetyltransferase [Anaerolineae bacterium]
MTLQYRILRTMPEFVQLGELAVSVWGFHAREIVPPALMQVITLNGGMMMGAYDGEQMIGMSLCMPAWRGAERFLWSHWTAVHKAYQRQGIGLVLKQQQRMWALENGYTTVRWTFDPLQRGNAHFNFGLLTAVGALYSHTYHVNFYGEMTDDVNRGLPSDRLEVTWDLKASPLNPSEQETPTPILTSVNHAPELDLATVGQAALLSAYVPPALATLRSIDPALALQWRLALREALQTAFAASYRVIALHREGDTNHYILQKGEPA